MIRTPVRSALLVVLPLLLVSCAAGTLVPERQSMPAARASLLPEYRIFYDSLVDYGEWILIEPFGYVFRPRVNFVAWRPYDDGFWAPTDIYGWTWISSEPFGWATYHYGTWTFDRFQGWVWIPGADWSPAMVNWQASDDYIGWAPQLPPGGSYANIPGGGFSFVPLDQMGSTRLSSKILDQDQVAARVTNVRPADDVVVIDGKRINRGPSIEWVERKTGPLPRALVQDLVVPGDLASLRERGAAGRTTPSGDGFAPDARAGSGLRRVTSPDSTRRAADAAAREARSIVQRGSIGTRIPVVRPFGVPGRVADRTPVAPPARTRGKAAPDTTRSK